MTCDVGMDLDVDLHVDLDVDLAIDLDIRVDVDANASKGVPNKQGRIMPQYVPRTPTKRHLQICCLNTCT